MYIVLGSDAVRPIELETEVEEYLTLKSKPTKYSYSSAYRAFMTYYQNLNNSQNTMMSGRYKNGRVLF